MLYYLKTKSTHEKYIQKLGQEFHTTNARELFSEN
jgi:hypothetical protein